MDCRAAPGSWIALGLMLIGWPAALAEARGPLSHVAGAHRPLAEIQTWRAPAFDYAAAAAEPIVKGEPVQVGRRFAVDVTPENSGDWEAPASGGRLWRLRFASSGALWMVLGFDRFELQPGATLYLVGQDGKHVQSYTGNDVQPHGQLWTAPVPGDELVLELHWPLDLSRQDPELHLAYVSHGYRPFGAIGREETDKAFGQSGSCNIDVACPEGDAWRDEIRGAMLILKNGSAYCSGSLINNSAEDCKNYVLTANHCFSPSEGPTMAFQFNFDREGCGSGPPRPVQVVTGGASFRAASAASDFFLAEMLGDVPAEIHPYYNGWSRSTIAAVESTGIHHPSGDVKKISFDTDPLVSTGTRWRVTEWEQGTTEGGSSGSPIFNQDHLIVGQLYGGLASCSQPNQYDEYGKLSTSWTGGGTSATRLSDWLDPAGNSSAELPGVDITACTATSLVSLQESHFDDTQGGNGDGVIGPGEVIVLTVDAGNDGSVVATEVVGTLTTSTPGVEVAIPTVGFPDIAPGAIDTSQFQIQIDPTFDCGATILLDLSLTAAQSLYTTQTPIVLATGVDSVTVAFEDDLEQGSANWTIQSTQGASPWALTTADSNSPSTSWFAPDTAARNDQALLLDTFAGLAPDQALVFHHRYNTEAGYDGGVLEYQLNGGTWRDAASLMIAGGYTGNIVLSAQSNLAGRAVWAGSSDGWSEVRIDLSSLAGNNVRFRWRLATDTSVSAEGWYVDDVQLLEVTSTCTVAAPGEAAGPGSSALFTIQHSRGLYTLEWSQPATGAPPAGYRLYATPLFGPYGPTCERELGPDTDVALPALSDNSGFLIVAVNAGGEGPYGTDSTGGQRPPATGADTCP